MAKKQTFTDKVGKEANIKSFVKVFSATKSSNGHIKFQENMVALPDGEKADTYIKKHFSSK